MKKSSAKVCRFRKSAYLCNPVTKQGRLTEATWAERGGAWKGGPEGLKYMWSSLKRLKKVQGSKYQNTKNESVDFFLLIGIESAGLNLENKEIYKEEFDPGSG